MHKHSKLTLTLHKGNKKKKTGKADDFYRNSHFLLTNDCSLCFQISVSVCMLVGNRRVNH